VAVARVRVPVATVAVVSIELGCGQPDGLLHKEKGDEASEHVQANPDAVRVIVGVVDGSVVGGSVVGGSVVGGSVAVVVGIERMRQEVQEHIAKQAADGKAHQGLEQGRVMLGVVVDRHQQEDEHGRDADKQGCGKRPLPGTEILEDGDQAVGCGDQALGVHKDRRGGERSLLFTKISAHVCEKKRDRYLALVSTCACEWPWPSWLSAPAGPAVFLGRSVPAGLLRLAGSCECPWLCECPWPWLCPCPCECECPCPSTSLRTSLRSSCAWTRAGAARSKRPAASRTNTTPKRRITNDHVYQSVGPI